MAFCNLTKYYETKPMSASSFCYRLSLAGKADASGNTKGKDLFMGAYQTRYLSGEPFGERWEERAVDALMRAVGG